MKRIFTEPEKRIKIENVGNKMKRNKNETKIGHKEVEDNLCGLMKVCFIRYTL